MIPQFSWQFILVFPGQTVTSICLRKTACTPFPNGVRFHKWRERLTPNEISYNTALNAWVGGAQILAW